MASLAEQQLAVLELGKGARTLGERDIILVWAAEYEVDATLIEWRKPIARAIAESRTVVSKDHVLARVREQRQAQLGFRDINPKAERRLNGKWRDSAINRDRALKEGVR